MSYRKLIFLLRKEIYIIKRKENEELLEMFKVKDFVEVAKKMYGMIKYSKLSKSNFVAKEYTDEVLKDYDLLYDEFGRLWLYSEKEGIWLENAEKDLNKILREEYLKENHQRQYCVDEVTSDIKGRAFKRGAFEEPSPDLIPFNDKIYDLVKDKPINYSKKYFFTGKLPVNIDTKNNLCPTIDKIFNDILGEKDSLILYQLAAYCLYRAYPNQKIFFLVGDGRNGKTTYINILTKLLDKENVSSVNAKDLEYNDFYPSELYGKLLNNCGELDENVFRSTSMLKKLTGGDMITAQKKFKEPFKFQNYAKMLITTNKLPQTTDRSAGFYRRARIIEFPFIFDVGKNAIVEVEKNIPEPEYEAFARKCIKILKKMKDSNFMLNGHKSIEETMTEYENKSSPLVMFLKEKTIKNTDSKISCKNFYNQFNAYLALRKIPEWSPNAITKELKDKGFEMKTLSVKKKDGERTTRKFWIGFKLK